jgi:hypothetical protein
VYIADDTQSDPGESCIAFVRLSELIARGDDNYLGTLLGSFRCSKNNDVQTFLRKKAVHVERMKKGCTYLVVSVPSDADTNSTLDVVGYFTIALRYIEIGEGVSKNKRQKINGSSVSDDGTLIVVGYLIGQLAKNDNTTNSVPGTLILDVALDQIKQVQANVGGRFVLVECEHVPKLISFYENNGFKYLQDNPNGNLAQLLCHI